MTRSLNAEPLRNPASNGASFASRGGQSLERSDTEVRHIGMLTLRPETDDLPQSWWFASTAVPLIAATIGPLANVLSIAALVSKWRVTLPDDGQLPAGSDANGIDIPDPEWEIILNAISLACGFIGNFFLLLNFTRRIKYIVALPFTIIFWFLATGILTGIVISMHVYAPPIRPGQTYSQGFWHAVIASVLYMLGSVMLMFNMLGYFMGKYPQNFELDDNQRTLILQTMMFFFWLAIGAAIFQAVCGWSYADALYFCDVTVLTVGFGDYVAPNDVGRGLVFPYSVFGIVFLGLMINSIRKFAVSMSQDNIVKAHEAHTLNKTLGRTVTNEKELRDRLGLPPRRTSNAGRKTSNAGQGIDQFGRLEIKGRAITFYENKPAVHAVGRGGAGRRKVHHTSSTSLKALSRDEKMKARSESGDRKQRRAERRKKLLLLKEEKDRFDAMREIQADTRRFRQYYALSMSVLAFGILWCIGALVFMYAERREQDLSYFEALYFCYVSLLTIGYGDFSPKSNAGKPFFVVWSLIAVPTMTILVNDLGDTVVSAYNRGTFTLADWTVMPKKGLWRKILKDYPQLLEWLQRFQSKRDARKRLKRGFTVGDESMENGDDAAEGEIHPTLEKLADAQLSQHQLARKLGIAIRKVAQDLHSEHKKRYSYEEWVEFTRLIRFSKWTKDEVQMNLENEEEEGLVEWDWIGDDSPMLSGIGETQWVLDRLCESLNRYTRRQARMNDHNDTKEVSRRRRRRNRRLQPGLERDSTSSNSEDDVGEGSSGSTEVQAQYSRAHDFATHDTRGTTTSLTRLHGSPEHDAVEAWERRIAADRAIQNTIEHGREIP